MKSIESKKIEYPVIELDVYPGEEAYELIEKLNNLNEKLLCKKPHLIDVNKELIVTQKVLLDLL